jgi:competence protein ComEC
MEFPTITTIAYNQGSLLMRAIYGLRAHTYDVIYQSMPFPESALLGGILLGIDWDLPPLLMAGYRAAGIIHIIAISGFNIAVISGLVIRAFRRILPMYWDGFLAIIAISAYAILAGAQPPVIRAVIMGSMSIPAYYIGRRQIGIHSLTLAAAVMLAANPLILWDISFQLSYLACLGLLIFADPLQRFLSNPISRKYGDNAVKPALPLLALMSTTWSAQFVVLPVLLHMDRSLPVLALPANLLLLPLQPLVMGIGGATVLGGLVWLPLGRLLGRICWPLLAFCNRVAMRLGMHPMSIMTLPPQSLVIAVGLVGVATAWGVWRHLKMFDRPGASHVIDDHSHSSWA